MRILKRLLSIFMIFSMLLCTLSFAGGCSNSESSPDKKYDEPLVIDVFDSLANFQGLQSGWFAKIIKDKFNIELNIIAPNVTGGGDTLYQSLVATGSIGDLIISTTEDGSMQTLIDKGIVLDMSAYLKDKALLKNYNDAIMTLNNSFTQDGIYAIPSEISLQPATTPSEGLDLTFGAYLRWDLYKELGYPEIDTLESLLPVLKKMQELSPVTEDGYPVYGFSFFKDWDGNLMNAAKQPACFYGYDEIGFVLAKADGSDFQSIIDPDSLYCRVLRFFYEANQLGLVDPDSYTQNYFETFEKFQQGRILFSPWPWLGQSAYNTEANISEGRGFMPVSVKDSQIFSYGCNRLGNQRTVISVGAQTKDPERMVDFIDWLYSPEGIRINGAQPNSGAAGPRGLTWDYSEDGPYLTEFGKKAFLTPATPVPEEWGGGTWENGVSMLNFTSVAITDPDDNGYPYKYTLWDSYAELNTSPLYQDWSNHMNASSTIEYLIKNNQILVAPGCDYVQPPSGNEIATLRAQCREIIVNYSWQLIFAKDDSEFEQLMSEMYDIAMALGYETVLAFDMQSALDQDAVRKKAAAGSAADR